MMYILCTANLGLLLLAATACYKALNAHSIPISIAMSNSKQLQTSHTSSMHSAESDCINYVHKYIDALQYASMHAATITTVLHCCCCCYCC